MKDRRRDDGGFGDDGAVSRSQRRRDALAVLDLAHALMAAPARAIEALEIETGLKALVHESRRVTQQVARKRQTQFLAKQLRRDEAAVAAIRRALAGSDEDRRRETARLHRLERWRARLLEEGDAALEALVEDCPDADRQALRTLVRQARAEAATGKPPAAARRIFRMLAELFPEGETH
jgi:ribosome-associated protein